MMYVEYFELLIGIGLFHSLMVVDRQHKSLLSLAYTFSAQTTSLKYCSEPALFILGANA